MTTSVGILGLGAYLPSVLRTNDFWPASVIASWAPKERPPAPPSDEPEPAGMRAVREAMEALAGDPFQGARERRVMPDDMKSSDMEILAGRDALARAGVAPHEIDVVLGMSFVPDVLSAPNACVVHRGLGLRRDVFSLNLDTVCNSFQTQLELATALVRAGQAKRVLMFQSSALSRLNPMGEVFSPWFGDGATAQVVGPVSEGRGVLGRHHITDGALYGALQVGVPGGNWYDEARTVSYVGDRRLSRLMLMSVADQGSEVIGQALAAAGLGPRDVDFFACHQASVWFRRVVQDHVGLAKARSVDTFTFAGSLSGANIPLVLATADRDGLLKEDDVVLTFGGGTGVTVSSMVVRWGA